MKRRSSGGRRDGTQNNDNLSCNEVKLKPKCLRRNLEELNNVNK